MRISKKGARWSIVQIKNVNFNILPRHCSNIGQINSHLFVLFGGFNPSKKFVSLIFDGQTEEIIEGPCL